MFWLTSAPVCSIHETSCLESWSEDCWQLLCQKMKELTSSESLVHTFRIADIKDNTCQWHKQWLKDECTTMHYVCLLLSRLQITSCLMLKCISENWYWRHLLRKCTSASSPENTGNCHVDYDRPKNLFDKVSPLKKMTFYSFFGFLMTEPQLKYSRRMFILLVKQFSDLSWPS